MGQTDSMSGEGELLEELREVRDRLRRDNAKKGREPVVCTDSALEQMARHPPMKETDLLAVDGFGNSSVSRYGADFLRITRRYAAKNAGGSGIDAETARALRELQKRLVNLSRSNRMLYMPRTGTGTSFDIGARSGSAAVSLMMDKKGKISADRKAEPAVFRRLNEILREVNRDLREHGTYDLYIGYPFVEGMLPGEGGFQIRAPLALFPVSMTKRGGVVSISYDDDRDAVLNSTLMLAYMKAAGIRGDVADAVIEENRDLGALIETFYSDLGLGFSGGVEPFAEYSKDSMPAYAKGTYAVTPNAVLGRFPSYSSLVERDVDLMINGKEVNENLRGLLKGIYSSDFRSEYPLPLSAADLASRGIIPRETELFEIGDLDAAQEAALSALSAMDGLVVQGPPGTGKSQVITAMIASAAASGMTVLMVSEKKTALDVVRSRLGELSGYCMQIDDTADKEGFFRQLNGIIRMRGPDGIPDLHTAAERIDSLVSELGQMSDEVFSPGRFGISPADLWDECGNGTEEIYAKTPMSLLSLSMSDIDRLTAKFSDPRLIRRLRSYSTYVSAMPWAEYLRTDLSEKDLASMVEDLGEIYQETKSAPKKGFLSRLFSRGSHSKHADAMAAKYLEGYSRSDVEDMISDCGGAAEFLQDYELFQADAEVYRSLDQDERSWWRGMCTIYRKTGVDHPESAKILTAFLKNEHLREFEARRPALEAESAKADALREEIRSLMERRHGDCRSAAEYVLSDYLSEITGSKRFADISRIAGQKRKWSIAKFVGRYGYELFRGIRIWLMTPDAVSETVPLEMGTFDLLVFDEASQMFVERGVPSIYRAGKTVIAGDHKQLRPSALGKGRFSYGDEEAPEEGSLLDLARSRYDSVLLNYHYRSEMSALIEFSDRAFYGGKLFVAPDAAVPETPPIQVVRTDGIWADRANAVEAAKVVSVLRSVLAERRENETVGVIAFNVHQMNLISDLIEDECAEDPGFSDIVLREESRTENGSDVGLFVKNVESVQGDERDVIIFSIGYARDSEGRFPQRFGWLNTAGGENRLNVAITRARKRIIVIQSFDPDEILGESGGPALLRSYLKYAEAVSSGDSAGTAAILDSLSPPGSDRMSGNPGFMDRLYAEITSEGFEADRNLGLSGCAIDIGVKKGGRYVLGIEDDRRIYALGGTARERDFHREVFLSRRGWKTVRVWTPAVQRDPDGEIARILAEVRAAYGS